jgi:hypothetical protein
VRFVSGDRHVVLEFQAAKTELQDRIIGRALRDSRGLRVPTPEDLIILKLIANRSKDQIDLVGLCGLLDLDWDYVERWAREWQVSELLQQIRNHP